ncbi:MAG: hypothetical protein H6832_12660 [Planctomycetes bacterium]|nr:hypothetical protein [Planctomycetota bacterium]MCB9919245.1 hypothetical protein [Planctomycetota bacterium]
MVKSTARLVASRGGATPSLAVLALAVLSACTSQGTAEPGGGGNPETRITPQLDPKVELTDRHTLRLRFELTGGSRSDRDAVETLLGEALAQSAWIDIAGAEDAALPEAGDTLIMRGTLVPDSRSVLTSTFERDGSTPLAGVRDFAWPDLTTAIDRLAIETRRTLGEPLDSIQSESRPCSALVSADLRVASACGIAKDLLSRRRLPLADSTLTQAVSRDAACALALSLLAGVRMDNGRPESAVEFARRALALEGRLSPSAAGRAARVILLAEGRGPDALLEFAETTLAKRPHDKNALFTKGLALALGRRYAEALPILESLYPRFPISPGLLFALGHANLALGKLEQVEELLPKIAMRVPELPAERLRAFALLAAGDHAALQTLFDRLDDRPGFRSGRGRLMLVTMRASLAILEKRDDDATRLCLEILDRMRALPDVIQERPDTLVEFAWTLSRLGAAKEAQTALAALRGPDGFPEPLRAKAALASGMLQLAVGGAIGPDRIRNVEELGSRSGARRLEGLVFKKVGNIDRALLSLRAAMPGSVDPTLVLEIAECEALTGHLDAAKRLRQDLENELTVPRLDAPREHALLRPSYALALREVRSGV